ncbi:PRELI domain containing protein 3B-like [Haliotis cracherodii]|uniref:PRELI domain containing protein 3B-like n=1 Tax=Haliotis cracherodii TaxID=6455 RepID=UPI001EB05C4C
MKIWTSDHTFDHPWETVVKAAWRKYPNPMNPSVQGIDVVERQVTPDGKLKSHRLLSTSWGLSAWVTKIVGMDQVCYASEHSEVDTANRTLTMRTRNLTFCNVVTVDEYLSYVPHPEDRTRTTLHQEAVVTVKGVPLGSYLETVMTDSISNNAGKGRQAMEWVIGRIKTEAQDLKQEAQKCMDTVLPKTPTSRTTSL